MKPIFYPTDDDRALKNPVRWVFGGLSILVSWGLVLFVMLKWSMR